jgi:hypothetical protein
MSKIYLINGRGFDPHQFQIGICGRVVEGSGLIIRFSKETSLVRTQPDALFIQKIKIRCIKLLNKKY